MSFDELYESCFRNASLVKVPLAKGKDPDPSLSVTLDHVICNSQYVIFFLGGVQNSSFAPKNSDLVQKLEHLVAKRNAAKEGNNKCESSPARLRRFFGMKKKKKSKDLNGEQNNVSVVVVDAESRANEENHTHAQPGWYILSPQSATTKSRLLRSLGFEVAPSLSVVDSSSRVVVTTEGRRLLHDDPNGDTFPWWPPAPVDVLRGTLSRAEGEETIEWKDLSKKVRGLFFGAYWCPPCRQWVKQLVPVYQSLKKADISLEIIFCSSDRNKEFYDQFAGTMPWSSFPFDPQHTLQLTRLFNVSGIPSLILIDENNQVISRHGRQTLLGDPTGTFFPWGDAPLYELSELSLCRLRDEPSLILFTEGSPEDVHFSLSVLDKVSKRLFEEREQWKSKRIQDAKERSDENGNGSLQHSASQEECSSVESDVSVPPQADPLQIFYTGEDPICDHILEKTLGLGDAELPLICIVDGLGGRVSVCVEPDVSEEILDSFVSNYKEGKLPWTDLPTGYDQNCRTIGGIPAQIIEQTLMGNSPSQNSISEKNTV